MRADGGAVTVTLAPGGEPAVEIRERVTATDRDGVQAVLYAHVGNEQVGALDYTRRGDAVCINLIFVVPQFRQCGVGGALRRHLHQLYPRCAVTDKGSRAADLC